MDLTVKDIKVFVPALNFLESLRFYEALGWQINFRADNDDIAELELAGQRFYFQNFYNKDWADNYMLHITGEDAEALEEHATAVIEKGNFKNTRIGEPKEHSYGALVTPIRDPSGVLLHFAQFLN